MGEREKLEVAIGYTDRVAQEKLGTSEGQLFKDICRWLSQLHALKYPEEEPDNTVVSLDEYRIREEREFKDEQMLYVEALWGRETFAFNIAIRDVEAMRRGTEPPTKPLRPPETDYECELAISHIRWLANEIARLSGNEDFVRPEDDVSVGR